MIFEIGKYYICGDTNDVILIKDETIKNYIIDIVSDPNGVWYGTTNKKLTKDHSLLYTYTLMKAYNTPLWKVLNGGDN